MASQRRRLIFGIMVAFPFLLFLFIEGGLRLIGYGPDLSLFTTEVLNGREYHIMNPAVKYRYFSRVAFEPSTSPDHFMVPKPAGTFRIFCLGGSTTVGFPYWYNAAFSTFLRDRLRRTFPDRSIEVLNLGMTATNSYTVLDMTREIMEYEPDLVLVYDGHNEFYGALGVASRESMGGARWLSQLSLRLVHLRTFLAMRDGYALLGTLIGGEDPGSRGTMMEKLARGRYVPYGSELYKAGLDVFRANMQDIRAICASHGVPLIFGTQVSNIRGLPPFISTDVTSHSPALQLSFHQAFNAGETAMVNGAFDSALSSFREAAQLLPHHAETRFQIAVCFDTLGRRSEARAAYRLARDEDELRFRTSSDFNDAILGMDDGKTTTAVDMEQTFASRSPDSLVGYGLVLEHLHPSSFGQFLIARGYANAMRARGMIAPSDEWSHRDTITDDKLWRDRTVTLLDERLAERRTEVLITAWPFQQEEGLISAISPADTIGVIADRAARGEIHWRQGHELAAEHDRARGDMAGYAREHRTLLSQFPLTERGACLEAARALWARGDTDNARSVLEALLLLQPDDSAAIAILREVNGHPAGKERSRGR